MSSVVLNEWICPECAYENRYKGEGHGIYPAVKHRAFTVELLYFWMHECMERGIYFRSELDANDCKQLGIREYKRTSMKWFRSIVMDGKVIGALREYPAGPRKPVTLVGAKGLPYKVISNRDNRTSFKQLTQGMRRLIRAFEYGRSANVKDYLCETNGSMNFRLGYLRQLKGDTKNNYEQTLKLDRWFCDTESCLCTGKNWTSSLRH